MTAVVRLGDKFGDLDFEAFRLSIGRAVVLKLRLETLVGRLSSDGLLGTPPPAPFVFCCCWRKKDALRRCVDDPLFVGSAGLSVLNDQASSTEHPRSRGWAVLLVGIIMLSISTVPRLFVLRCLLAACFFGKKPVETGVDVGMLSSKGCGDLVPVSQVQTPLLVVSPCLLKPFSSQASNGSNPMSDFVRPFLLPSIATPSPEGFFVMKEVRMSSSSRCKVLPADVVLLWFRLELTLSFATVMVEIMSCFICVAFFVSVLTVSFLKIDRTLYEFGLIEVPLSCLVD